MMIKCGGSLVEPASVPRVLESELPEVEMMAELMAEGAEERAKRCNFLPNCCVHPDPDQHGSGSIVAEKLGAPAFSDSQRSGCQHADAASRDFVKLGCGFQKLSTRTADIRSSPALHSRLNGLRNSEQASVRRRFERFDPVAFEESVAVRFLGRSVCQHVPTSLWTESQISKHKAVARHDFSHLDRSEEHTSEL